MKKIFLIIGMLLALVLPAIADYNNYPPMPDKYLMPDGSVTTWSGVEVSAPDAGRAGLYDRTQCQVAKWLMPDGSIVAALPFSGGGGTLTGTGTNHYWSYWTGVSTLGAKTITALKPICSDANGDPAVCAGTEGVWQQAGSYLTAANIAASISDSDTTHCPDGNSVYDALAGKQASGSYQPLHANLSSLALLSWASGAPFVTMTAAGTFALDTTVYQVYNAYLTGIDQDLSTAGSPHHVGVVVGAGGFTATKQNGVAGLMTVYNATTTSTLYMGWMGPASLTSAESYSLQFPIAEPAAGQVMAFGVPAGGGDPNGNKVSAITWITPFTAATTLGSWTSGAGTVALGDTYLAALQKIDGNVAGKANVNADTTGLTAANVPAPTTTVGSGAISVTTKNTYVICTTTCAVTLPVAAAGIQACIRNAPGSATAITLVNRASQYYELTTHAAWATVNQKLVSGGVATDSICVVGYDATHYATFSSTGTWTDTAP